MQIVAVPAAGRPALFVVHLHHGADPRQLLWARGYRAVRFLSAGLVHDEIRITVQVARHHSARTISPQRVRMMDPGLEISVADEIVQRQRPAAYAIVLSTRGVLATEFSEKTAVPGMFGLPGGGIDAGESPSQAVVREVREEASQAIELDQLLDVQTDHWIGLSPGGVLEDFHAVRVIYSAQCPDPTVPVVQDIGGTTASARWVPLAEWRRAAWTSGFRMLLDRHLPDLTDNTERHAG
ncbi:NUDIX hydrolase [Propionicicella superfundia]|uniref:NUDIX hydrolase n=1 Tax=Propionicicella superfundia TaxID=348582 RepID=UPI000A0073A9|nr:NUDIX domain-containing protein [Propionicicella superfundia]